MVPLVWGAGPLPTVLPFDEASIWVANDAENSIVRINTETGRVDARLNMEAGAGLAEIGQGFGNVVVKAGGSLTRVDQANLIWGAAATAQGGMYVANGVVYMVDEAGTVEALSPDSLEPIGDEVDLDAAPMRAVVSDDRLVVPTDDGRVTVIEDDEVVGEDDFGDSGDELQATLLGKSVVVMNFSQGKMGQVDPGADDVKVEDEASFEPPAGEVLVPEELPDGLVWLAAERRGELLGIDPETGDTEATKSVAEPGSELTIPVSVPGSVVLVDLDGRQLVTVDTENLDAEPARESIEFNDPNSVEVLVAAESVVVNDRSSATAHVVSGTGEIKPVDKYSTDGVATEMPEVDLASEADPQTTPPPGNNEHDLPPQPPVGSTTTPPAGPAPPPPPTTTRPPTTTTTVPSVDPPGAVTGLSARPGDGRIDLSWSAPNGNVDGYAIAINPAAGGQTQVTTTGTSYSFTNLANGTVYTFTVSARNEGGSGSGTDTTAAPGRAPAVSGVSATRTGDRSFSVSFSYNAGGRALDSCTVSVGGTTVDASCSGGSGSASGLSVSNYGTSYTFTAAVATALGDASAGDSASSDGKPLTVSGETARFDGTCTWSWDGRPNTRPYFSSPAHACPGNTGEPSGYISSGTTVRATCRTSGDSVKDDNETASSTWLYISGEGYMNTLWFDEYQNSPQGNLPSC